MSVVNYCYVASARRRSRPWGARPRGVEGRGISCRHAHSLFFSVEAPEKPPKQQIKKVRKMYISPYPPYAPIPPNFLKFGLRGQVTDIITCVKFLVNRFRDYGVLTPQNCHFRLTCCRPYNSVRVRRWKGEERVEGIICWKIDTKTQLF